MIAHPCKLISFDHTLSCVVNISCVACTCASAEKIIWYELTRVVGIIMRLCGLILVLVTVFCAPVSSSELVAAVEDGTCPPWTYRQNTTCQCGSIGHGIIQCDITSGTLTLQMCTCMTYDPQTNHSVAGRCVYSCITNWTQPVYHLPMIRENFTELTCRWWKREGPLCSKCIQGHGFPLYTYDLKCVQCTGFHIKELFEFLAKSLIPPTLLCIVATVFHLNVLQPPWSVFVLGAQLISSPPLMQGSLNKFKHFPSIFIATVYGPWNLDFFRALYHPKCISPHINFLHASLIDGAIGLYPLVLVAVMYTFVTLRDRGCKIIIQMWKPFHYLLARFQSRINLKTSLVDTFATLLLLSYMKIGYAAFYILAPTRLWSPDGSYVWVVYIDPSLKYFGPSHAGYAIVTLLLSFTVLLVPVIILLLYPCLCFQRCLNRLHLRSLTLHTFVDAFQGCYKDGTNGTRDCRYFAALQLVLRLLFPLVFLFTEELITSAFLYFVVLVLYIALFVIAQPYKYAMYNKTDIPLLLALLFAPVRVYHAMLVHGHSSRIVSSLLVFLPLLYPIIWSVVYIKPIITHCSWCRKETPETSQLLSHAEQ